MLVETLVTCPNPRCRRKSVISVNVPSEEVGFVATIHQCHFMLCRRYYLSVINVLSPGVFCNQELDKKIMDQASGEEKKRHVSESFIMGLTDEIREQLGLSDSDTIIMVGTEEYLGSNFPAEEIQDYIRSRDEESSEESLSDPTEGYQFVIPNDPITDGELATMAKEFDCLSRGQRPPWET